MTLLRRRRRMRFIGDLASWVVPVALSIATAGVGTPLLVAGAVGLVSVAEFANLDCQPQIDAVKSNPTGFRSKCDQNKPEREPSRLPQQTLMGNIVDGCWLILLFTLGLVYEPIVSGAHV
jgi:hypothetical protein